LPLICNFINYVKSKNEKQKSVLKGGLVVVIMSLIVACDQKEVPVVVDREAIKTEIQAMEDALRNHNITRTA
jgi:hypothetical protein